MFIKLRTILSYPDFIQSSIQRVYYLRKAFNPSPICAYDGTFASSLILGSIGIEPTCVLGIEPIRGRGGKVTLISSIYWF